MEVVVGRWWMGKRLAAISYRLTANSGLRRQAVTGRQ
jgi:hypothetical protein